MVFDSSLSGSIQNFRLMQFYIRQFLKSKFCNDTKIKSSSQGLGVVVIPLSDSMHCKFLKSILWNLCNRNGPNRIEKVLQENVKSTSTVSPIISCPWSLLKQAMHLSNMVGPGQTLCPEPENYYRAW